jgi:hypothetical protein
MSRKHIEMPQLDSNESDGKGHFIIRNGQKIASYEAWKWVPLLPGVVIRITPDGAKIEMPPH